MHGFTKISSYSTIIVYRLHYCIYVMEMTWSGPLACLFPPFVVHKGSGSLVRNVALYQSCTTIKWILRRELKRFATVWNTISFKLSVCLFYLGKIWLDLRVQFNAIQSSTSKLSLIRNIHGLGVQGDIPPAPGAKLRFFRKNLQPTKLGSSATNKLWWANRWAIFGTLQSLITFDPVGGFSKTQLFLLGWKWPPKQL